MQEMWVQSLGREDLQRRKWQPTPVFFPGESHGQRSLMGCGRTEWGTWLKILSTELFSVQFSSVAESCQTLCYPMDCSMPGLPVHHHLPEFTQTHVHWVSEAIQHLIFCRPLLLPNSIFPSIRVFSNESVLQLRWPKYWSFRFSVSPSNEHPGLFSFRMDWLDLLAVQGTLKSLLQHHSTKASILQCSGFL